MQPESSLLCSQKPDTSPYPQTDESSSHLPTLSPQIYSSIILRLISLLKVVRVLCIIQTRFFEANAIFFYFWSAKKF